jgi:hypothetical protein
MQQKYETFLLVDDSTPPVAVDATHDGASLKVEALREKTVQIVKGAGSVSIIIQGSINGTSWFDLTTAQTADTILTFAQTLKYMRIKRTAGGVPDATGGVFLAGLDSRAD